MKTKLRRLGYFALFTFIAFGLFTSFVPCKYSSKASVMRRLGFNVQAKLVGSCNGTDCNCNMYTYNVWECPGANNCTPSSWGCGPFWYFECNGCIISAD